MSKSRNIQQVEKVSTCFYFKYHKEGIDLGEMDAILLKKIEELMLYTLQQQATIEMLQQELNTLKQASNK